MERFKQTFELSRWYEKDWFCKYIHSKSSNSNNKKNKTKAEAGIAEVADGKDRINIASIWISKLSEIIIMNEINNELSKREKT